MPTPVFDNLNLISLPLIVTQSDGKTVFINKFARRSLPACRIGVKMYKYLDRDGPRFKLEGSYTALEPMYGPSSIYRRALIIPMDQKEVPDLLLWIFDHALYLVQEGQSQKFLAECEKSLRPLFKGFTGKGVKPYVVRREKLSEVIQKFSDLLYKRVKGTAAVSVIFRKTVSVEALRYFLEENIVKPARILGCSGFIRLEEEASANVYGVELCRYLLAFIRLFVIAINVSHEKDFQIALLSTGSYLQTEIEVGLEYIEDESPIHGGFDQLHDLINCDMYDIAMASSFFGRGGDLRFGFDVMPHSSLNLKMWFKVPTVAIRTLAQPTKFTKKEEELYKQLLETSVKWVQSRFE